MLWGGPSGARSQKSGEQRRTSVPSQPTPDTWDLTPAFPLVTRHSSLATVSPGRDHLLCPATPSCYDAFRVDYRPPARRRLRVIPVLPPCGTGGIHHYWTPPVPQGGRTGVTSRPPAAAVRRHSFGSTDCFSFRSGGSTMHGDKRIRREYHAQTPSSTAACHSDRSH
jgi:hypothetical protein